MEAEQQSDSLSREEVRSDNVQRGFGDVPLQAGKRRSAPGKYLTHPVYYSTSNADNIVEYYLHVMSCSIYQLLYLFVFV